MLGSALFSILNSRGWSEAAILRTVLVTMSGGRTKLYQDSRELA